MKNIAMSFLILTVILILFGFNSKAARLSIRAFDANQVLFAESESDGQNSSEEITLTIEREYLAGDYLVIEGAKKLFVQFDVHIPGCYVYSPSGRVTFRIPFHENGKNYPEESFSGTKHQIKVRICAKEEWSTYRNLSLNSFDIRGETDYYPHATSNSECRGETYYAARNAIDGYKTNTMHGKWPYHSWGPDKGDTLWFKIDYGRMVEIDKLVIVNRAQYFDNHDSFWNQALVEFSDGKTETIKIEKTHLPQEIKIKKHKTSSVKFSSLKAQEPKWCSWIEVETWGRDKDIDLTDK